MTPSWIILRTKPSSTLKLAASLADDGFGVWTPARRETVRRARWNVRRDVRVPLLAGFVFADASHIFDLLELAAMPVKPRRLCGRYSKPAHASFSVLRDPLDPDGIPIVADHHLEPLREAEIPARVKRRFASFAPGSVVRITSGGFTGMIAVVDRSNRKNAVVSISFFGRHQRVEIPTSILKLDEAYRLLSETDDAAREAA